MSDKKHYDYVFVVLLYRNMTDVVDLIQSIKENILDYHIILVNNFYDEETKGQAEKIANSIDSCTFLALENHGYGAGNNAGIRYAMTYFDYRYIIVCNPDTIIKKFDPSVLLGMDEEAIYAPKIISKDHKRQNPNWGFHSDVLEYLQYLACKKENIFLDYAVIAVLKIIRIIIGYVGDLHLVKRIKVGNAHGSFFIISKSALLKLAPLFDEKMFLFYEEVYLGNKAYRNKIPVYYTPELFIEHKEDGSMRIANVNTRKEAHKSVIYYFEHKEK